MSNAKLSSSGYYNPAATYINTNTARFQLLDVTGGLEIRGLGSLLQLGDDVGDSVDRFQTRLDEFQDENNDDSDVNLVLDAIDDLEATLDVGIERLQGQFSATPGVLFSLPLLPLQLNTPWLDGPLTIGVSLLSGGRASILHSKVEFNIDEDTISDSDSDFEASEFLSTASSLYMKTGRAWNFSAGYAQPIPNFNVRGAELIVGGRGNLIMANLHKQLYPLSELISEATSEDGDIDAYFQMIQDDALEGLADGDLSAAFGLDLGVMLQWTDAHVGLAVANLNAPKIRYNTIGVNCAQLPTEQEQNGCYHADYFTSSGKISASEEHVMAPRVTVDAGYQLLNNNIAFGGSLDLVPGTDLFGDRSQNFGLAVLFQPTEWYWPRARIGFGKDLQDWEPTTWALGLSFFNVLQIDQSVTANFSDVFSDDSVDQLNALRGFKTNVALNVSF
ncbi:conjugal transfer protein TraF [Salinispirillum sp. LH 10-3-1]|uniref:Conjugal transfer protein TraF n=1 Tax=Salinispirillum sp. LH 10-3-1 TaxID=2952525 RepID=A0AB38YJF0_9GAMM